MIAFLSARELGAARSLECTPVSRVRDQLRMMHGTREPKYADPRLRTDLKTLLARLGRVRARGGAFQGVEISEHAEESVKSLKMVGNEMLVLYPERRGA